MIARSTLALGLVGSLFLGSAGAATFTFNYMDAAGEGFFDETPVTPVPGNNGTTLGQQRRNLVEQAAVLWGSQLSSAVPITVDAEFANISCNSSGGTLAQAGTIGLYNNFPGTPRPDVNYPQSLANALAGRDVDPGNSEINLSINDRVDPENSGCFSNANGFYYGSSGTVPDGEIALFPVLLHELAHGLGFTSFIDSTGRFIGDLPGVFDLQAFDLETMAFFDEMNNSQRSIAARNDPFLVWSGQAANAAAQAFLVGQRAIVVNAPASIAGSYDAVDAAATPPVPGAGLSGQIVVVVDDNGRLNDGCDTITNTAELSGRLAMIQRSSSCNWFDVAFRMRNNGVDVLALLVANNNGDDPADVGENFSNPPEDFVTSIGVGENLFDAVLAESAAVSGAVTRDQANKAGTREGFVRLYGPSGYDSGSSVSHWTLDASPDLLMEPEQGDVGLNQIDITGDFLRDLGWPSDDIFADGFGG